MCTVTFLPLKKGFILTSNRDEAIDRAKKVIFPEIVSFDEDTLIFPKDLQGGGTWMAADSSGKVAVLLNGGFEPHESKGNYRKSRGLVVLDTFGYDNAKAFTKHYDFSNIEPFTLVLASYNKGTTTLDQIVWDGNKAHLKTLKTNEAQIWSSSSLYNKTARDNREKWFDAFLKKGDFSVFGIRNFHQFGGNNDPKNDLKMQRSENLATVSISSVIFDDRGGEFTYQDLLSEKSVTEFL